MNGPYLYETSDGLTLAPEASDATRLGLVRVFLGPPLSVVLAALLWLVYPIPVEALACGALGLSTLLVLMGLVGLATARRKAAGGTVLVRADGVTLPGGRTIPRSSVAGVVVAPGSGASPGAGCRSRRPVALGPRSPVRRGPPGG